MITLYIVRRRRRFVRRELPLSRMELTLQDILWSLKRHFVWICLITLLFVAGSWIYTENFITPLYQTKISMCVFADDRLDSTVTSGQLSADASIARTYSILLASQPVTQAVSEALDGEVSYSQVQTMLSTELVSQVIYVTVTCPDPQLAYRVANALTDVAPKTIGTLARAGEMVPVDRAYVPVSPSSPHLASNILIGFFIGLLLSCLVVILFALLDTTIWREEDLERSFNIPVLGSVPNMSSEGSPSEKKKRRGR